MKYQLGAACIMASIALFGLTDMSKAAGPGDPVAAYESQFPNHPISEAEFNWMGQEAQRQMDCNMQCPVRDPPPDVLAHMRCGMKCGPKAASASPSGKRNQVGVPLHYYYIVGLAPHGDNWLALRTEPSGRSGRRIAELGPEELLLKLDKSGKWIKVQTTSGKIGWVFSSYIACCKTKL